MRKETLNKDIFRLAAPAILNNITVPLLGLCDTAIAGHLGSPSYLGAIAVGAMMLNVFFWLAGFLRMGTTGLTARGFGKNDFGQCREVLRKSLILVGGISLIVIILQIPLLNILTSLIAPEEDVKELSSLYFRIGVWGVPAQLTVMAVSGWFIGLQTTVVPMTIAIATNIFNIVMSIFLTFGLKRGFTGIALGTLIANWGGAIMALVWARNRFNSLKEEPKLLTPEKFNINNDGVKWHEFFKVNGALFIRSACIMSVTLTVTAIGAKLGDLTLAANAIIMQFFIFFSYFMDGFAFSGEALAGKFSGGGNMQMVRKLMHVLCGWGGAMALLFFIIYFFGSGFISSLLTDSPEVIAEVGKYRLWILLLPPITVLAFIFDGLFIGLTRTATMMWVTIAGAAVFFILQFALNIPLSNNLLWLSFEAYLFIRGMSLALSFNHTLKSLR